MTSADAIPTDGGVRKPAYEVGGVRVDALTMDEAVSAVLTPAGGRAVHLCNVYTIALASKNESLRQGLNRGNLNLPDGMPLIWVARRLGLDHMTRRVNGPELMANCLDGGRAGGVRHFLYGSTPEVLSRLRTEIEARWPGVVIAGVESPPFRELTDDDLTEAVQRFGEASVDVVWVGLGTPKQDVAVDRLCGLGPQTYVAIGAAFDFLAGTKKHAPRWMQDRGLEWLFRLGTEPRRLWKRYLVGNTWFLVRVVLPRRWRDLGVSP